jgi:hypothetical protein
MHDCAVDSMRDGAAREKRCIQFVEETPHPAKKMTVGGKRAPVFVKGYTEIAFNGETAVGLLCKFCKFILKDPQLNSTRFSEHLYVYKKSSLEARHDAWTGCMRLYSRPFPSISGEWSQLRHGLGSASLSALDSGTSRVIGSTYRLPSIDMPDIDMPRLSSTCRFHISICHVFYCQVTHITINDGTVTPHIPLPCHPHHNM